MSSFKQNEEDIPHEEMKAVDDDSEQEDENEDEGDSDEESEEEFVYDDSEGDSDEESEEEFYDDSAADSRSLSDIPACPFQLVGEDDIRKKLMQRMISTQDRNCVPPAAAFHFNRHFKWKREILCENYFGNEENIQKAIGVWARCAQQNRNGRKRIRQDSEKRKCPICFDKIDPQDMMEMPCGHEFCMDCWNGYITSQINDGPSCILATCPQDKCTELIYEAEVEKAAPELLEKFKTYMVRSYVELSPKMRWCPGAGCDRIAVVHDEDNNETVAKCGKCKEQFCFNCGQDHEPVPCSIFSKWNLKCSDASETANFILANTKPCPKCDVRIEKNQGCNHMTCRQCQHHFCWICMGDWSSHNDFYNCNRLQNAEKNQNSTSRKNAQSDLERYLHYFSRHHGHADGEKFAKKQLKELEQSMEESDGNAHAFTKDQCRFVVEANKQLIECRRFLKMTYIVAFYLVCMRDKLDNNMKQKNLSQQDMFEGHQSYLEKLTEDLSELLEKPDQEKKYLDIVNVASATEKFMHNIQKYMHEEVLDSLDE